MIPAKRFQCLDGETDSALMDMLKAGDGLYNEAKSEVNNASEELAEFIDQSSQDLEQIAKDINEAVSEVDSMDEVLSQGKDLVKSAKDIANSQEIRDVKSLYGNIKDIANNGPKMLEAQVKGMLPKDIPGLSGAFSQLANNCKNRASAYPGLGKPYDASLNCNGNNKKAGAGACNNGGFNDILNKLTGGDYNSSYSDLNRTLMALMGLSNFGYSMNMCGVFGALSNSLGTGNSGLLSRASAGLVGELATGKNGSGLLDLAASSLGLNAKSELPGIAKTFLGGFSIPDEIKETGFSALKDALDGAVGIFDDSFGTSELSDLIDVSAMEDMDPDLSALYDSSLMDTALDLDDLEALPETDGMSVAFSSWKDEEVFNIRTTVTPLEQFDIPVFDDSVFA